MYYFLASTGATKLVPSTHHIVHSHGIEAMIWTVALLRQTKRQRKSREELKRHLYLTFAAKSKRKLVGEKDIFAGLTKISSFYLKKTISLVKDVRYNASFFLEEQD